MGMNENIFQNKHVFTLVITDFDEFVSGLTKLRSPKHETFLEKIDAILTDDNPQYCTIVHQALH